MPEIFSNFTTTFFALIGLIILGIIFKKQLIALEDKFDEKVKEVKRDVCKQKKTQSYR